MHARETRTFTTGGAVVRKRLVKLSGASVVHNTAAATDDPIGVAEYAAASGEQVAVRYLTGGSSLEATAATDIAAGALVYAAADGKVQKLPAGAGTYRQIGIALEAAAADGDIIEILPYNYGATKTV